MKQPLLESAIHELAKQDKDVNEALALVGMPSSRIRDPGLETLVSIVVSQQISTEAAASIMSRLRSLLPVMTADDLLACEDSALRQAGLSARKVEYCRSLAAAVDSGALPLDDLSRMDDDEAINTITALRGFGRWSAEIYLMFSLGRRDIFPADDLALQIALGRLKKHDQKPSARDCRVITETWSPWRSAGAIFLWHYYRGAPT